MSQAPAPVIQLSEGISLCSSHSSGLPELVLGLALLSSEQERESFKTGVCNIGFILQLNQLFLLLKANKTFKLFSQSEESIEQSFPS